MKYYSAIKRNTFESVLMRWMNLEPIMQSEVSQKEKNRYHIFTHMFYLDCKEIKPINPKGSKSWIFIGRTDAEAETPILWPPNVKYWLIRKDPDAGKDWRQEEKGTTEDEMVGWHHWFNGHEFEQAPGDCDGQGSLVCCSPWGSKESDMTEQLNWTELSPEET